MVEVLAAMAVLVILVLALTGLFMEASNITRRGTTMIMRNSTIETAMETILKDVEGMAVNERLPCYIVADTVDDGPDGFGFDEAWFVTTSGDQDDDRAYQLRRYYVRDQIRTNAMGVPFRRFQLWRDVWIFAVADSHEVDVMGQNVQWWETAPAWGAAHQYMLADNVVRFDIYCKGWDGLDWMGGHNIPGVPHYFSSREGPGGGEPRNVAPAAFDIYLQITSPEAAEEGGMALVDPATPPEIQASARAMMIRESATMLGRATPVMGAAQLHHPARHYTDPPP